MAKSFTDTIFQRVKLYVEGVEVPFISISVTNGIGVLPSAQIVIPPQAGLMDISRFYQPKVHIFYEDTLNDYDESNPDAIKKKDKLLFSGVIAGPAYYKSKDTGASVGISFNCVHRYSFINDMLIDYTGWLGRDYLNQNNSSGLKVDTANSMASVMTALVGIQDPDVTKGKEITPDEPDGQTWVLPNKFKDFYPRLMGMPGVLVNYWNQMKRSAYNKALRQGDLYYAEPFVKMYEPLVEDGLQFFNRLSGHFPIEGMVQADEHRVDPCPETPGVKEKIIIPPARQLFLSSSIQSDMTLSNVASFMQNSGEVTTIYQIFSDFYESIDYEMVTLSSPAEVALRTNFVKGDSTDEFAQAEGSSTKYHAIDTIVKPKMPFYFSPTCNVLFPGMYSSVSVVYDEINVPTRINMKNIEVTDNAGNMPTNFHAPYSIREAIAKKVAGVNGGLGYSQKVKIGENPDGTAIEREVSLAQKGWDKDTKFSLRATMRGDYGAIGLYEQGRGIKKETMHMPRWLSFFSHSTSGGNRPLADKTPDKTNEPARYEALKKLAAGFAKRYPGDAVLTLNPFATDDVDISAHHRLLFSAADYYYTQRFAASKAGSVQCPFNPHITPGYPMDILESNPLYPSFHATCASVTHTFTAASASTSVQFVGAMTYSELANYYIPMVSPMLLVALDLAENPTLVNPDEKAMITAGDFYRWTLGTGAVSPDQIIDFNTMLIKPKKWAQDGKWSDGSDASVAGANGGELNPMLSYQGNMSLTYRPIESRKEVEERFSIKFIDMDPGNYGTTIMKYRDKNLDDTTKFEIGRSQFLDYSTYFGQLIQKQEAGGIIVERDRGGNITQVVDQRNNIRTGD